MKCEREGGVVMQLRKRIIEGGSLYTQSQNISNLACAVMSRSNVKMRTGSQKSARRLNWNWSLISR